MFVKLTAAARIGLFLLTGYAVGQETPFEIRSVTAVPISCGTTATGVFTSADNVWYGVLADGRAFFGPVKTHFCHSDPPFPPGYYISWTGARLDSLSAGTHTIRLVADSTNTVSEPPADKEYAKTILVQGGPSVCVPNAATLCLNGGRFRVQVSWLTTTQNGVGAATSLTADTGYFWFFSANNIELVVKVVDGRSFNSKFWVFAGGLTNVDTTISVTDTQTGFTRTYHNPAGVAFQPIQDTAAF